MSDEQNYQCCNIFENIFSLCGHVLQNTCSIQRFNGECTEALYLRWVNKHIIVHCIIALKASGRDCTNNNELLHKIGVLQRYAMQLFVFTSEILQAIDGAVSITVVPKESEKG